MNERKIDTRYLATLAMLCAIMIVMGVTGIGFIPLPLIKATTMHIPVILGAILLGPSAGAILGAVFGLFSIWANTVSPGIVSFAFSPFMTTEGMPGVAKSIWIALCCRILFGYLAGLLWQLAKKSKVPSLVALPAVSALSSMCNTLLVMGSIYVLLAEQYAQAKDVAMSAVFNLVIGTVTAAGIPEAIIAAVLVTALVKVLMPLTKKLRKE